MINPFQWKNGKAMTPEEVDRARALADAALGRAGDTSPVGHWTQGAARVIDTLGGVLKDKRASKAEKAGLAGADAYIQGNPVLAALLGGGGGNYATGGGYSGGGSSFMAQPTTMPVAPDGPNMGANVSPEELAAMDAASVGDWNGGPIDAMKPEAFSTFGIGQGPDTQYGMPPSHDHASHSGQSHGDWLKYSNSSATRNDPLDPALISAMSFLPELGVTMDVISGGQEAAGEGGSRTGSTRHDHGKAADVDFYKDGRKLSWNNPNDLPILTEIIQTAKANGVGGIGAGDDYMGDGRFHVGFGAPSVWGAGGKGENAPSWLVDAYNGVEIGNAPQGSAPSGGGMSPGGSPIPISGGGAGSMSAITAALSDPWVAKKYGPVLNALMGQEMKRGDMQYEAQLRQSDPMYQAQLKAAEAALQPAPMKPIEVGGVLLDPVTYQPIFDSRAPEVADPFAGTKMVGDALIAPDGQGGFAPVYTPAPDPGFRMLTPEEAATVPGLDPAKAYQVGPDNKIVPIGGDSGVTVNVGGNDSELNKALSKGEGELWSGYLSTGAVSAGTSQDLDALDALIPLAPQGPLLGRAAEMFPGFSTAGDAFQSIVKRIAPTLRAPGSGSTSDIEYDGMLRSLPKLSNNPEANKVIASIMRSKAQLNQERAAIIQAYQNGEFGANGDAEARRRMAELDKRSIMTPEAYAALGITPPTAVTGAAPAGQSGVPAGVDPSDWEFMTPEERALFQ